MSAGRRRLLAFGLVGVALGGLVFVLQAPPPADPARVPETPSAAATPPGPGASPPSPNAAIYRWRDDRGGIHLTSQPPPAGVPVDVIPIGGATSPPPAPARAPEGEPRPPPSPRAADLAGRPLEVYTPQGFQELVERLGDTRRAMEERDRILDQLQRELRP